ncbi:MAG: hypothetical protein LBI64_04965, partial [Coriobacteriales bacterium]|nr:hypothetical protein [Coriobacteriales bacterium]
AYEDLVAADAESKWLVILSDGDFYDPSYYPPDAVEADLHRFTADNRREDSSLRVALLQIGSGVTPIANDPENYVYVAQAIDGSDILTKMTAFANLVFERNQISYSGDYVITPDIDLSEVVVFAQGADATIGDAQNGETSLSPTSLVDVKWSENQEAEFEGMLVPAVPNTSLRGQIATFGGIEKGSTEFVINGASQVDIFYKPSVNFGVEVLDQQGNKVDTDKIVAGDYIVNYGFTDSEGQFIASELLGKVIYHTTVSVDGEVVIADFQSGDTLTFRRGETILDITATFLGQNSAKSQITFTVLQEARPSAFAVSDNEYPVSELNDLNFPRDAMELHWYQIVDGQEQEFTVGEWAAISDQSLSISTTSKVTFEIHKGEAVGSVLVMPGAWEGDVFATDTGDIRVAVSASYTYDEQAIATDYDLDVRIIDDLSLLDRFWDWFATYGIPCLIGLALLILIIGWLVKPRFKIDRHPKVKGSALPAARIRGTKDLPDQTGALKVDLLSSILPFVAQKGIYEYFPPGSGFSSLKVKAARDEQMHILNIATFQKEGGPTISLGTKDLNKKRGKEYVYSKKDVWSQSSPIKYASDKHSFVCSPRK